VGGPLTSGSRSIRIGGTAYPLILPSLRDPRLHSAIVILSLQVLGQTVLHFQLSIAQILAAIATSAILEVVITFKQQRVLMWPASALLTGNSVAFILRAVGTQSGDWWSLNGVSLFVFTSAVSLLSKYVIRRGTRHVFNPSNLGLVLCFLLFGSQYTNPQDLWWGPMTPGLALTLAIIVLGGLLIVREIRMLAMVATFWVAFSAFVGVVASQGHCISARWHDGPICGTSFWTLLISSPEILVFIFFMMTDPKTAPRGQVGRIVYGLSLAFVGAVLVAPWQTEFATKVAFLSALTLICAALPLAERYLPAPGATSDRFPLQPTLRRGAVLFGALSASALVLQASASLGMPAPSTVTGAVAVNPSFLTNRPVLAVDQALVASVTIDSKVHRFAPSFPDSTAHQMAHDAIEDLMIEGIAIRQLDKRLGRTAVIGSRLRELQRVIDTATTVGQTVVPSYRFRTVVIVLVSSPSSAQSPPQLAIHLTGNVHLVTYSTSSPGQVVSESDTPCDMVLTTVAVGSRYLITAERPQ